MAETIQQPKPRTNFTKVFVKYIKGKNNKIGFVAEYYKDIAEILVKRGYVEIITDPDATARAAEDLRLSKENAIVKKAKVEKKDTE